MHPEIDLVSRDRGGDYAAGAREGAPQAIQCADRFPLLKNLGEALEGFLAHHLAAERKRQTQVTLDLVDTCPCLATLTSNSLLSTARTSSTGSTGGTSGPIHSGDHLTQAWHESSRHCPTGRHRV